MDLLLRKFLPDPQERAFLVRCLVEEGPAHHRGSNYVLVSLLGLVLERLGGGGAPPAGPTVTVPLRLPPHLEAEVDDAEFPLPLACAPLLELVAPGSRDFEAATDCLTDGPPQHVVANLLMVALLERILAALPPGSK